MKNYKNLSLESFWKTLKKRGWKGEQSMESSFSSFSSFPNKSNYSVISFILLEKELFKENSKKKYLSESEQLDLLESAILLGAPHCFFQRSSKDSPENVGSSLMACVSMSGYTEEHYVNLTLKLLEYGAKINQLDWEGETVAFWAVEKLEKNIFLLEGLFKVYDEAGLNWELKSQMRNGQTLSDFAPFVQDILDRIKIEKERQALSECLPETHPSKLSSSKINRI